MPGQTYTLNGESVTVESTIDGDRLHHLLAEVTSSSADLAGLLKATVSASAEDTDVITITGAVTSFDDTPVESTKKVYWHAVNNNGSDLTDVTVTTGTGEIFVPLATFGQASGVLTTDATGAFVAEFTDAGTGTWHIFFTPESGLPGHVAITYA